ncbi:MAG TPA: LamG-like jellyroll fold domain-containing protein [Pyrinomonadaceae bacterium]|jgi:hypothetical protein
MKKRTCIFASLVLTALAAASLLWNFSANTASAQKADDLGIAVAFNARDDFSNTQNPNGAWTYGYSNSDTDNALNLFTFPADSLTSAGCSGGNFEAWRLNNGDQIPQITRHSTPISCSNIPGNALFVHPGFGGQRAVVRWTAPVAGTFQLTGSLQRQNLIATTDLKIIKNAATPGESVIFAGSNVSTYQISYNVTVTVAAGDTLDFSVGNGNGSQVSDGSSIVINIAQPATACLTAAANLQVNVPAENSPVDVESVNTNASLAGDATYANRGKVGHAFEFDGSGDYVRIEDNAAQRPATALTLEGWFKFDAVPGIVSLISKPVRNSALNSYTLYLDGGQLRGLIGNQSQYTRVFSAFTPQAGVWHHLAFTYDYSGGVSTLRLYANGVEVTSGQDGTANLPLSYDANPFPLLIGGEYENNAPAFTLDGQADEVSVYGRALSQNEIFDIVQRGSFGKCAPGATCTQAPNNLVSLFAGEGNALDSRSNNHGALQNGATYSNGKVGQVFNFPTLSDFVSVPDSPSLRPTNLTLEGWFNFSAAPSGVQVLASKNAPVGNSFVIYYDNGFLRGQTGNGSGTFSFPVSVAFAPTVGQWYHIAYTWQSGGNEVLYVDGAAVDANSADLAPVYSNNPFTVGAGGGFSFQGRADEISLYSRALTAAEISSLHNADSSGKCKPVTTNPAADLVGFWTGDGDARDFLGLNPVGILHGDANFRVGRGGQAFRFDGSGDYVEIADDADHRPANVTVEGWFKVNSLSGAPHFVSKPLVGNNSNSYVVWYQNGELRGGHGNSTGGFDTLLTGFTPNLGEWYHFAYTIDDAADTHRFFVNGAQIASGTTALPIYYDTVNAHPLLIGGELDSGVLGSFLDGMADEVSLYSRALSPAEIAAVYNAGAAGKVKAKAVNFVAPAIGKTSKTRFSADNLLPPASVQLSDATVTFANVTSGGAVSESGIDLAFLPPLPSGAIFTGLAYDVSTGAAYQQGAADDVQVCFNVPALTGVPFSSLRIVHLENGAWVNRTAAAGTSPNLCTDDLSSLAGAFAIVQSLAPTAARVSISGRVLDGGGNGIGGATVTLTDSQGASVSVRTSSFGNYAFPNVAAGEIYVVGVSARRYTFTVSTRALNVEDAVENVDFTADSGASRETLTPLSKTGR